MTAPRRDSGKHGADATQGANAKQRGHDHDKPEIISVWEWVTGALGLLLVIGALGVMLHETTLPHAPPHLIAHVDSVQRVPGGFLAHVTVRNAGSAATASVVVEGTMAGEGASVRSEVTLDHVPAGASRGLGLLFQHDPTASLQVRVLGFAYQ